MINRNKHISALIFRKGSSPKISILLLWVLCLFSVALNGQTLTNEGAVINVSNAVVDGGDVENTSGGDIINEGIINLEGSYVNSANTRGNGYYNLKGDWINLNFFAPDNSTVQLNGNTIQNIINPVGDQFYNLRINNDGAYAGGAGSKILLNHSIEVLNILRLDQGIIEFTDRINNKLYLVNRDFESLIYTSGRIIGKFERGIGDAENYLFPLGSSEYYNPLNLKPNVITSSGSVLSDFRRPNSLANGGLPLIDSFAIDTSEIYETFPEGYWTLDANEGFATADYNIDMDGAGFTNVQPITRVLKQEVASGIWEVDGTHVDVTNGTVAGRENLDDGIPNNGNHYGFGRARPHIKRQPVNDTICELNTVIGLTDYASFKVKASGRRPLSYQWQIFEGGSWIDIDAAYWDFSTYLGTDEKELLIIPYYRLNNRQYRVRVTDKHNNDKYSDVVTLTVEPIPTTLATPQEEVLCNGETTSISFTTDLNLPGTTFILEVLSTGNGISGTVDNVLFPGDDVIAQTLNNPGSVLDSVVYRILPFAPGTLYCEGYADTVIIWVNPTPDIDILLPDSVICNEGSTSFAMSTLNTRIRGDWYYDLTVVPAAGISGERADGRFDDPAFTETLYNNTSNVQKVEYYFHPVIEPDDGGMHCENGGVNDTMLIVWVNPTPDIDIDVTDTVICNESFATVDITTLNDVLRGDWYYDISVVDNEDNAIGSPDASLDDRRISEGVLTLNLTNNTPHVKRVTYNFHPVIEPDDNGADCENGVPNDTSIVIFVNPTPVLLVSVPLSLTSEQIYCNGDSVTFSIDNNQNVIGTIKYDLEVTGAGLPYMYGNKITEMGRIVEDFTDTLIHYQSAITGLNYRLSPYIESLTGSTTCYRSDTEQDFDISVVPVLTADIAPSPYMGDFEIRCFGEDSDIDLTVVGGDYRYNYTIDWRAEDKDGALLQESAYVKGDVLADRQAGSYYFAIRDTLGCFHDSIKVMREPLLLQVIKDSIDNPDCLGDGFYGSIFIDSISGGAYTFDYTYSWISTGSGQDFGTERNLLDVSIDEYKVIITDVNGCRTSHNAELDAADPFYASVVYRKKYGVFDVSCNGESDAILQVNGNGIETPFNFTWYDEDLNVLNHFDTISNRPAGTYYFQVKNALGCLTGKLPQDSIVMVTVTEPDPISFQRDPEDLYDGAWDIPCNGDTLGKLSVSYFGGHTAYFGNTYSWTSLNGYGLVPGDSIQRNLSAGSYNILVTDSIGCFADSTFVLEEPDLITFTDSLRVNTYGPDNVTCYGDSDGEIYLLNLSGGGPKNDPGDGPEDYTYKWTPPAGVVLEDNSVRNLTGIPAGLYSVRVTDVLGCYVDKDTLVTQPDSLYALPDSSAFNGYEISCYNGNNGMISLTPHGGTRSYTYDWNGIGGSSDTVINGLSRGYYSVSITDMNGCSNFYDWTLIDPDTIVLNPWDSDLIECYGDTSTLHISPAGGVREYSYLWNGVPDDSALNGIEDGRYIVELTDKNGCVVSDTLYLRQRSRIMPEIVVLSDYNGESISCFGASDASIELIISGGDSTSYTREWSLGADYDGMWKLDDLPAGIYTVQGVDGAGCAYDTTIELIAPQAIDIRYTATDPLCDGATNGVIRIAPQGGTPIVGSPVYNYSFNGTDSLALPEFSNLGEGVYEVAVTDANLCSDTIDISLVAPEAFFMEYDTIPAECPDESNGALIITFIDGGTQPYVINGGLSWEFRDLSPGEFVINLVDAQKCTYTDTVTIGSVHQSCLTIPNAFTPNGDGANDVWRLDEDENGSDMYLYPDAELTIINRWGEVVYFSNDVANEPWDGTYKGRDLPIDSYYYMLDLKNGDEVIKGNVTIIR